MSEHQCYEFQTVDFVLSTINRSMGAREHCVRSRAEHELPAELSLSITLTIQALSYFSLT